METDTPTRSRGARRSPTPRGSVLDSSSSWPAAPLAAARPPGPAGADDDDAGSSDDDAGSSDSDMDLRTALRTYMNSLPDLVSLDSGSDTGSLPDLVSVDSPGRDMGLPDLVSLNYDRSFRIATRYQSARVRGTSTLEGYHRNVWNLLQRPSAPEP